MENDGNAALSSNFTPRKKWVFEGFRCLEIEFALPDGKFGTEAGRPRCNKRLPRETQNSIEGNKTPAKTHFPRM
jgi:hypothetical protein